MRRVSRFFKPDKPALFDLSLDIFPGEFIYLTGPSGAGKSTLLNLIHLTERPDTGALYFAGHNVAGLQKKALSVLRRSIGCVFQDFRLVPYLTVAANIGLPLEIAGARPRDIRAAVSTMLEQTGLVGRADEKAVALSGGEQQRVAVARALIGKPEIILADEPTGSLDPYSAEYVFELLETASAAGAAVVFATHDRMLIASHPHRYIALDNGRIVGASPPDSGTGSRRRKETPSGAEPDASWRSA